MGAAVADTESGEPMMDINTTPLIDVMLVLLIMLIITIPPQTAAMVSDAWLARTPNQGTSRSSRRSIVEISATRAPATEKRIRTTTPGSDRNEAQIMCAAAAPIPREAPVTTATRPARDSSSDIFGHDLDRLVVIAHVDDVVHAVRLTRTQIYAQLRLHGLTAIRIRTSYLKRKRPK